MFFLYMVLVVLFMVALMVFLTRATVGVMGKLGGEAFQRIHESLEYIVDTGMVPPFWLPKATRRLTVLRAGNEASHKIDREIARVKKRCIRQLNKLVRYAERTSTVVDEETRQILLNHLSDARERWETMNWRELAGGSDRS